MKRLCLVLAALLWASSALAETKLLDFSASWCAPCRQMASTVDSLAAEGYVIERIDIDSNQALAQKYGVDGIPCFVVVEDGREVDRTTGVTQVGWFKSHLKKPQAKQQPKQAQPRQNAGQPNPAWRYVEPTGYRAALVRIYCEEGRGMSMGSGTVVRWGGRIVILTAKHVVAGAKRITISTCKGVKCVVRPVKIDYVWDCAVLEADQDLGVEPVMVEVGVANQPKAGDRFTSCGFGGDGKLAANTGLVLGFRASENAPRGIEDWMVISGHARFGDSGGGVFNAQGKLIGVLWGKTTDEKEVMCVQAGRIHILLNAATGYKPTAYEVLDSTPMQETEPFTGPMVPVAPRGGAACGPGGCVDGQCAPQPTQPQASGSGGYMIPYRNEQSQKDKQIEGKLDALQQQVGDLANGLRNMPPPAVQAPPQPIAPPVSAAQPVDTERNGNKLEQKLDDFLHKLPIQGPITKENEKLLESDSWIKRLTGFNAVILWQIIIVVVVGLVIHKIYQAAHAHKAAITAGLSQIPGVGVGLAAGFGRLDDFNTGIDMKAHSALSDMKAKLDSLHTKLDANTAATTVAAQAATQAAVNSAPTTVVSH